ncbi:hypothetical protein G4Q83_03255 [Xanthomonas theicola]|nr:hypothetical protein G4Q83_03255 [Xanthomonas theicola]
MDIDASFEADVQLVHASEPGMGALDDPAMTTQTIVAFDALAAILPRCLKWSGQQSMSEEPLTQRINAARAVKAVDARELSRVIVDSKMQENDPHPTDSRLR